MTNITLPPKQEGKSRWVKRHSIILFTGDKSSTHKERSPIVKYLYNWLIFTDIMNVLWSRTGGPITTDDDELCFSTALPFLIRCTQEERDEWGWSSTRDWAQQRMPNLARRHDDDWFRAAEAEARMSRAPGVDDIAQALRVTQHEVKRLKLYSLVAHDRPKAVRVEERKAADRLRKETDRRQTGGPNRAQYLAKAQRKRDTATALDISTRTLERWESKRRKWYDQWRSQRLDRVAGCSATHLKEELLEQLATLPPNLLLPPRGRNPKSRILHSLVRLSGQEAA